MNDLLIWTFIISDLGPYKYLRFTFPSFNYTAESLFDEIMREKVLKILLLF